MMLFGVAKYILYEAYQRLKNLAEHQSTGMLIIAAIGLIVNLISMRLLSNGKDASVNIKGAYLEVWSDMLGSLGVIAGSLVIRSTGWTWVDSDIAVAIGFMGAATNLSIVEGKPQHFAGRRARGDGYR